jgi:hypothetical protein
MLWDHRDVLEALAHSNWTIVAFCSLLSNTRYLNNRNVSYSSEREDGVSIKQKGLSPPPNLMVDTRLRSVAHKLPWRLPVIKSARDHFMSLLIGGSALTSAKRVRK